MTSRSPVLIVRPEPSRGLGAFYRNLGLTMVATHLRAHGLDPVLVDLTFDALAPHLAAGARAALFSLYIDDYARGVEIAGQLKHADRGVTTFVGGPHVTLLREDTFTIGDAFDVVAVGDCLPDAMPLVAATARGETSPRGQLIAAPTSKARMDGLPPDYSIWPEGRYFPVFPVEMGRGCRQRCPFCTDPVLRTGLALDPVDRTIHTIRALAAEHGEICVRFVDSSMSSLGTDLDVLLDGLIRAELPVRWSAYAYPHDITPDLARRMAAAGCTALFLGIESLGDGVRVGKHHTKRPEEVARAVDALHDHGIFVHGNFIIGLPGETPGTVEQTLDGIGSIGFDSIGGGPFFLTPGSTFERSPDKFGIKMLDPTWRTSQHVNFYDSSHEYFRTATLTQPQMRQLAADFRTEVQSRGLACWNLSDYAAICWQSVGGDLNSLTRLWRSPEHLLTDDQRLVLGVLKEKIGVSAAHDAARFVRLTAELTSANAEVTA